MPIPRMFEEELEEFFDNESVLREIKRKLKSLELKDSVKLEYTIKINAFLNGSISDKTFNQYRRRIENKLYDIFLPRWAETHGLESADEEFTLEFERKSRSKSFWKMPISWHDSYYGTFSILERRLIADVLAILEMPEDLSRALKTILEVNGKVHGSEKSFSLATEVPKTREKSVFDMTKDKSKLLMHYLSEPIPEVIIAICRGRYSGVKWARASERPKVWRWLVYREQGITLDSEEELKERLEGNAISLFTAPNRRESTNPDFWPIDIDVGKLLSLYNPELAFNLGYKLLSKCIAYLEQEDAKFFVQPTGGVPPRAHIWVGIDEGMIPPQNYKDLIQKWLKPHGSETIEKYNNPFAFLRYLTQALFVNIIRNEFDKDDQKRFSIDKNNPDHYQCILAESPAYQNGLVRIPTSLHESTGNCAFRVVEPYIFHTMNTPSKWQRRCSPDFVRTDVKRNRDFYILQDSNDSEKFHAAPPSPSYVFSDLVNKLKEELFLTFYSSMHPMLNQDFALSISQKETEKLYAQYG